MSNGEERRYDFVVGADGIWSSMRPLIFPDAPEPVYAGQISIRWMAPGPAVHGEGWYVGVSQAGYIGVSHMMRLRAKCQ